MFTLLNAEVKPLTRELARDFRDLEPSPTERDLQPARVKHLRKKAEDGLLVTFHWSTAQFGNRRLRMNGQHSSAMLCDLDGAFPEGMSVHLDEYGVENDHDLALLFRQFDDRKSGRTTSDVSGAYQGLYEDLRGVPKEFAKLAIEGVGWWMKQIEGLPVGSGDDIYDLFGRSDLHEFIRWLGIDVLSSKTKEMHKTPIVAAIFATYDRNASAAKNFWVQVAKGGLDFDESSPATALDNWLKTLHEQKPGHKAEMKAAWYYQGAIFAWNAYRADKTLKNGQIQYSTSKGMLDVSS